MARLSIVVALPGGCVDDDDDNDDGDGDGDDDNKDLYINRSLGALRAPNSSLRPFGPALSPSGLLDFVLRALRALRPCNPRNSAMMGQ